MTVVKTEKNNNINECLTSLPVQDWTHQHVQEEQEIVQAGEDALRGTQSKREKRLICEFGL